MPDRDAASICPDEEQISAYVARGLDPAAHERVEHHIDGCEACSLLVADLVRIYSDDSGARSVMSSGSMTRTEGEAPEPKHEPELLQPGSAIGRYRTLECVGIGGMGVVYAAYDPQLDRRVALKLLIDGEGSNSERKRARLLREAQAMAKLTHPNVITVHDVGVWQGQVFVAMEFVEGGTLKSWMRDAERSWPEVRQIMTAAGRGLAAAHAAGLVHRDFKPDNVLIGTDGRVVVTDFGLARWEDAATGSGQQFASSGADGTLSLDDQDVLSAEVSLTRTGALVGTPAYMAPELYRHEVADAATDQYAFCVALYEAIYGRRPISGRTLAELAAAISSVEHIEFPSGVSVPRHVRGVIRRGLSRSRSDRYPTMAALLAALERRGVRRWKLAVFIAVPLAAVGLGAWVSRLDSAGDDACRDAGGPIEAVWTPERRASMDRAFSRSASPLASQASIVLLESVDAYTQEWASTAQATCEVQEAGGRSAFVGLSQRCLAHSRVALDVALQGFEEVDDADISRSMGFVDSIRRDCADETALLTEAPPPAPDELREDVERVRLDLAKVDGHLAAGNYDAGVELAKQLDVEAASLGVRALEAETKLALGRLLDLAGRFEEASETLERAELLAISSRFHRVTAEALVYGVYVQGVMLERADAARALARRAEAAGAAAGLGDEFRGALLLNRASVEYAAGNYEEAESAAAQALALSDRREDPLRWADAAFNLASIRIARGRTEAAIPTLYQYIETYEAEVGFMHPDVAIGYHTLSMALIERERTEDGEAALRTALKIVAETLGPDHANNAAPLSELASLEASRGHYDEAIALARRTSAIRRAHGFEPFAAAGDRRRIAEWLARSGRLDEALEEFAIAEREAFDATGDTEHPHLSEFFEVKALLAARSGDREATDAAMARAEALMAPVFGPGSRQWWRLKASHAALLRELGDTDDAIELLEDALANTSGDDTDERAARARFELAKLLHARDPGSTEARSLANAALRGYRSAGAGESAKRVADWLAKH
ncbi:MAG: protein kinase domain-containing protein [Nannocystaceae bacterium]|nr:protein kinase [bacterium]